MAVSVPSAPGAVHRPRHDRPPRRRGRRHGRDTGWALVLVGPLVIGLVIFYVYPMISTFYYSFTKWGVFGGTRWVGLKNYLTVLSSADVHQGLLNSVIYTAIVLTAVPIALVLATLMNQPGLRGRSAYRVVYFLPVVTMPVAVGMIWRLLLNGDYGLVNAVLRLFGVTGPSWLSDPRTALVALGLVGVWSVVGYNIVLFSAGLQTIPAHLYEAAQLDGAGPLRQFRHVTVPMISPTLFFVCVISVINALQMFDLVYIMIGPNNPVLGDTQTVVYLFYRLAFVENNKGLASAVVFVLLILILLLTALQFRLQRRWVTYD